MKSYDVVVIGGGAAGLLAAGTAAHRGCSVLLLEKMERCGRKLSITGKGRGNLTNAKEWDEFSTHIYPKADFFRPAFWGFSNKAVIDFFYSIGVDTVVERGDRVFPVCQKAPKVVEALVKWVKKRGVTVKTGANVTKLECADNNIRSVFYVQNGNLCNTNAEVVILATGGCSYPATGSTGDGYLLAESLGHAISPLFPSLTALMPKGYDERLQGVSLSNVKVSLLANGTTIQEEFGELSFTDLGIEGALGLRVSRNTIMAMREGKKVSLVINLKPALSCEQLEKRLSRECGEFKNEVFKHFLKRYLPANLIFPFLSAASVSPSTQLSSLSESNKLKILHQLQYWDFSIEGYGGFERAVVTAGGVSQEEIRKKDMRSKRVNNLFFAGEIIDLDGDTGGYNLQIAFSTGALAGEKAAEYLSQKRPKEVIE